MASGREIVCWPWMPPIPPLLSVRLRRGSRAVRRRGATYAVDGKRHTEAVIEAAWCYLRTNMDAGIDVSFAEVLARCPGVAPERVRAGFKRRLTSWIEEVR